MPNIMSKEHIAVAVRLRPPLPEEEHDGPECLRAEGARLLLTSPHRAKQFEIPLLFGPHSTQQEIFEALCLPLIEDMFKGYSCALLAYGQSRAGKSHSLRGGDSEESKGIVPRLVDHIARKLQVEVRKEITYLMRVSYVEICGEELIDLLSVRKQAVGVAEGVTGEPELRNAEMKSISKPEEIESYFLLGNRKRQLAYTKKYRRPENCTSIFSLHLESSEDGALRKGRFDLVDLAASEVVDRYEIPLSVVSRKKNYDLSESALRNVIRGLAFGNTQSLIPYHDSKITQLLRHSLGGNARTKILFHLHPSPKCYQTSLNTLRIATAAALIENSPSCHSDPSTTTIQHHMQQLIQAKHDYELSSQPPEQNYEEMEALSQENEFVSTSLLQKRESERKQEHATTKKQFKQKVDMLSRIFLTAEPLPNPHQLQFVKENYLLFQQKLAQGPPLKTSCEWMEGSSQEAARRLGKQEIADMQREVQQEREAVIDSLREMEQECCFYKAIAEKAMRREEIDLLRLNSRYDSTKRSYQVPSFAIREKKISHASRFGSSSSMSASKSISERRFLMTQLSASKIKGSIDSRKSQKILEIRQSSPTEHVYNPYFHPQPRKIRPKRDADKDYIPKVAENEYELRKIVSPKQSLKSRVQKVVSPQNMLKSASARFRFK